MADVNISKYRASVVRSGSTPATPGYVASEGQNPVDPSGSAQNHLPVTINPTATGLSITDSQILSGAGTVGQYIRGDGSLADFPSITGGGSSVSYYLNGSVSQGTIGGVAYKELNRTPVFGTGTDISISADGYIASFITDAGDPNKLEIPAGNWNFETYFSASSSGGSPSFYVELYKYNGTTFTLIASSSSSPELIAFGTNLNPYFSTLAVPQTALALTDRLAVRFYVTHSGRTITLHTENNHLCQIITSFTTGLTALNNLTSQVQFFAVGTSGSDFNIASSVDTHTFNLPTASASNRGALSSADWSTFNNKENAITAGTTAQYFRGDKTFQTLNTSVVPEGTNLYYTEARVNANTNVAANTAARHNAVTLGTANGLSLSTQVLSLGLASAGVTGALSGTDWSTFNSKQNALTLTTTGTSGAASLVGSTLNIPQYQAAGTYVTAVTASSPLASSGGTTPNITIQQASGSQNGFLSSTDWTTFNNKQNALTNPVTGTGTTNYLPKFTGSTTIGNSQIFDNGTNVGIGTTSFAYGPKMAINSTGQNALAIQTTDTSQGSSGTILYIGTGATTGNSSYGILRVLGNGGTAAANLVLQTTGNLLVGTTTDAGYKLDVNGTGRFSGALNITTSSSTALDIVGSASSTFIGLRDSSGSYVYLGSDDGDYLIQTPTSGYSTKFIVKNGGNVGIGTTSPASILHAESSTPTFTLRNTVVADSTQGAANNLSAGLITFGANGSFNVVGSIESKYGADASFGRIADLIFSTRNTSGLAERIRLTSSGNLLVGTTTDAGYKLDVSGTGRFSGNLTASGSGNIVIQAISSNNFPLFQLQDNRAGGNTWNIEGGRTLANLQFRSSIAGGTVLELSSTGAATFSSSVTAGRYTSIASSSYTNDFVNTNIGTVGQTVGIRFGYDGSTYNKGAVYFISKSANGVGDLIFALNNSENSANVSTSDERMRITSGGNVGIGTTSPTTKLDVRGIVAAIAGSGSNGLLFGDYGTDAGTFSISAISGRNIVIRDEYAGVERLRISSTGFVSAGATTNGRLGVRGFTNDSSGYAFEAANASGNSLFLVRNDGRVGIGAIPETIFHVAQANSGGQTILYVDNTAGSALNNEAVIKFSVDIGATATNGGAGISAINVNAGNAATDLRFLTFGGSYAERMRITSGGNVLIGTTTDSGDKLRVNGNTFTNTIMTYNPENDNRSGVAWRLGAASIGAVTPNRRLRVNVGGVEYYIGAVEV